jgi:hypothetical protein
MYYRCCVSAGADKSTSRNVKKKSLHDAPEAIWQSFKSPARPARQIPQQIHEDFCD